MGGWLSLPGLVVKEGMVAFEDGPVVLFLKGGELHVDDRFFLGGNVGGHIFLGAAEEMRLKPLLKLLHLFDGLHLCLYLIGSGGWVGGWMMVSFSSLAGISVATSSFVRRRWVVGGWEEAGLTELL